MSTTPKKPHAPSNARKQIPSTSATATPSDGTTNRSPSRMAAQSTVATSSVNGVSRARSVRNGAGTPVSARAAARKPAESDADVDDTRAEMQAKLEELQEHLQQAEQACENSQKHAQVLQFKLDEALKEQGVLEESLHEHTECIEGLENEKKDHLRSRRELEQIYEAERIAIMQEKEEASAREEEMQNTVQRMKETLAQREVRAGLDDERRPGMSQTASFRSNTADPNPDTGGQFAPPSSLQRSDSRSSSKLVMQKDKIIESLRLELAEAQIKLVEVENMGGGRQHELEKQMYDIKVQNARLMEENESFQLLLTEKTLHGDFAQSELLRAQSNSDSRPPSSRQPGTSLADELDHEEDVDAEGGAAASLEQIKGQSRLQAEMNSVKDQNKALTLYINNIISRLLQHEQFEAILDKTPDIMAGPSAISRKYGNPDTEKELPPSPPPKDEPKIEYPEQLQGFLQRARSVMGARPKRPTSQMVLPEHAPKVHDVQPRPHEDPITAPSVPLGRSTSTRGGGGHRRANSDWPAASVVTNMYRGPSPALQAPASPGLSSPTARNPFFSTPQPLVGSRAPSGSSVPTVPTISETESNKENVQHRDSKISDPKSNRNSVVSQPGASTLDVTDAQVQDGASSGLSDLSNPSSPPRSTTSSGERDDRSGGAIMMGSKMRPLRLVQDRVQEDEAAKKGANRGSWFGRAWL